MTPAGKKNYESSALSAIEAALEGGGKIGIACSGGSDSVFLAHSLVENFADKKHAFVMLHFNHKVRAAADGDERFSRALAKRLDIKFYSASAEAKPKNVSEESLRKLRLDFYRKGAEKFGLALIAQGHHLGDVAESMLMRLGRGSSSAGLCAPRPVSKFESLVFARPLLNLDKAEMQKALLERSETWREDESNSQNAYLRNRLRGGVLPLLEKLSPFGFQKPASRSRMLLEEDDCALESVLNAELEKGQGAEKKRMSLTPLVRANAALARRAFFRLLGANALPPPSRAADADKLVRAVVSGKSVKFSLGGNSVNYDAARAELFITPQRTEGYFIELKEGKNTLPCGGVLELEIVGVSAGLFKKISSGKIGHEECVYLDIDISSQKIFARNTLKDDAYAPIGSEKPRKVSRMLSDKKVQNMKRSRIPVVLTGKGKIAWAAHCAPNAAFRLEGPSRALRLTWNA